MFILENILFLDVDCISSDTSEATLLAQTSNQVNELGDAVSKKFDIPIANDSNVDWGSNAKSDDCQPNKSKLKNLCNYLHCLKQWGWHTSRSLIGKVYPMLRLDLFQVRIYKYTKKQCKEKKNFE